MKWIKTFEEIDYLDNKPNIKIIKSNTTKNGIKRVNYKFKYIGEIFIISFANTSVGVWERAYGIYDDDELVVKEIGLNISEIKFVNSIVNTTTNEFIFEIKPNALVIDHKNMNNESEVASNKLNKRAKLNYNALQFLIPDGYVLSYWSNYNLYLGIEAFTTCIIYKKGYDITKLINGKIEIS